MTAVALVAKEMKPCFSDPGHCEVYSGKAGEDLTRGQVVYIHTDGTWLLADAGVAAEDEPQGVVVYHDAPSGQQASILVRGPVEGFTVDGLNAGVLVFLANGTPGGIDTAVDADVPVARVWPLPDTTKVLYFCFRPCAVVVS